MHHKHSSTHSPAPMESSTITALFLLLLSMLCITAADPVLDCGACGGGKPPHKKPSTPKGPLPPVTLPPVAIPPVPQVPNLPIPPVPNLPVPPVGGLPIPPVAIPPVPQVGKLPVPPLPNLPVPPLPNLPMPPLPNLPLPPLPKLPVPPLPNLPMPPLPNLPLPPLPKLPLPPLPSLPPLPPTGLPMPPVGGLTPGKGKGKGKGKSPCPPTTPGKSPPSKETCPIDVLKLGACVDLLGGLVHIGLGDPVVNKCCPVLSGLVEVEAAVCLCTTLKIKLLNLKIFVPLALQLLVTCGKSPPPGFTCSI